GKPTMLGGIDALESRGTNRDGLATTLQGALVTCRIDADGEPTGDRQSGAGEAGRKFARGPATAGSWIARADHCKLRLAQRSRITENEKSRRRVGCSRELQRIERIGTQQQLRAARRQPVAILQHGAAIGLFEK